MSAASHRNHVPPSDNAFNASELQDWEIRSDGGGDDDDESVSVSSASTSAASSSTSQSSSLSSSASSSSSRSDATRSDPLIERHSQDSAIEKTNAELPRQLSRQDPSTLRRRPLPNAIAGLRRNAWDLTERNSGAYERERKSKRRRERSSAAPMSGSGSHRRRRRRPEPRSSRRRSRCPAADCCSGVSTLLVCTSFFVWLTCVVVEQSSVGPAARVAYGRPVPPSAHLRARAAQLPANRRPPPPPLVLPPPPSSSGFVTSVWNGVQAMFRASSSSATHSQPSATMTKKNVEDLDPGCVHEDWQLASYPSCNEIHAIDLGEVVREWKRRVRERENPSSNRTRLRQASTIDPMGSTRYPFGYLSDAGLWRTVWAVHDAVLSPSSTDAAPPLVLKLMKQEHEIDARNLDRHRREAVVMERLTSSPYVASIYGHCGTTVMTEFLGATLHTLIKAKDDESIRRRWGLDNSTYLSPSTPQGRLQMALHAARGLQALHENSIVHADLQDQQFLLSTHGADGLPRLVLNDFNRCRFLAHRAAGNGTNATTAAAAAACTFRIPTAPGSSRSPEEYAYEELTEQLDVFSLANVLHQILTGEDPWEGWSVLEISNQVQKGVKPMVPPELLEHPSDKLLQNLTLRAYELDPAIRIRVTELVRALETAMTTYF